MPQNVLVCNHQRNHVADGVALLHLNPSISKWEIANGSGGGVEDIFSRVHNANELRHKAVASIRSLNKPIKLVPIGR